MKKQLIKNWIIIFLLLFVTCFLIMSFYYVLFSKKVGFDFKNKKDYITTESYSIEIEMPEFNSYKMNKEVDKTVEAKKARFANNASEKMNIMKMNYSYSIHKNIYTFHYTTLYLENENFANREDEFKYYDSNENIELELKDLVNVNDELYSKLKHLVNKQKINIEVLDSSYNNILFSEDKAYLIIPNEIKNISIPIEYVELKKFLNEKYFEIDGDYVEIPKEEIKKEETKKEEIKEEIKKEEIKTGEKITPVIPEVRDEEYLRSKKLICFTFDDGPSKYTTKLLNGLSERKAKATFFIIGNRANNYRSTIIRMKNEGHTVAQHTWSHKNIKTIDEDTAKSQIDLANETLKNITGTYPIYIRPPYGEYNINVLNNTDMVFINWSIDPQDWKYKNATTVYNNIINKAYDGAIVLVHDLYETSIDGALQAMDYLSTKGYAFVSIDEMIYLRGKNVETHHVYSSFKK